MLQNALPRHTHAFSIVATRAPRYDRGRMGGATVTLEHEQAMSYYIYFDPPKLRHNLQFV